MADKKAKNTFTASLWDTLASVRLTVALLLLLAAVAVIGTLIPQGQEKIFYITRYSEVFARLIFTLRLDDMYHSPWFRALVIMLAANIVVCSIARLGTVFKIAFAKEPTFSLKNFERNVVERFTSSLSPEELAERCGEILSKRFPTTRRQELENGFYMFAERGRKSRLGVYIVHLAVLLLLLGSIMGSIGGFDGYVQIPEGGSADSVELHGSDDTIALPFSIRCDDFDVSFYESGRPKEYRSKLSIIEDGKVVLTRDIVVNRPLRYKGINIFQSSYGTSVKDIEISFTSGATGISYHKVMNIGDVAKIPEGLGSFRLTRFMESYRFMGEHNLGPCLAGIIEREGEKPQMVILPLKFPSFDKMRRGKAVVAVERFTESMYTGLQVTKDPGVPVVYASFILMIIGIYIAFFTSHQKFCLVVVREKGETVVTVSATANRNRPSAKRYAEHIAKRIKRL